MGVKFSRVIPLACAQIVPPEQEKTQITKLQQRLLDKLGGNAYPFFFRFPASAPASVVIQSGEANDKSKPLGVEYRVRTFVGESPDDVGHKRSTVSLAIKKVGVLVFVERSKLVRVIEFVENDVAFTRIGFEPDWQKIDHRGSVPKNVINGTCGKERQSEGSVISKWAGSTQFHYKFHKNPCYQKGIRKAHLQKVF